MTTKTKTPLFIAAKTPKAPAPKSQLRHTLTREEWLAKALPHMQSLVREMGSRLSLPSQPVSITLMAGKPVRVRKGQCWLTPCEGGATVGYISPLVGDGDTVLRLIAQVLTEAHYSAHKKRMAKFFDFSGLAAIAAQLGKYPSAPIQKAPKSAGNRQRKYQCEGCGQIIRAASDSLDIVCNKKLIDEKTRRPSRCGGKFLLA